MIRTTAKVIKFPRPKTFTANEDLIEELRELIFGSGKTYQQLSDECGVANSTISNLANGRTKWPRPSTLFPLLEAVGRRLALVKA